MLAIIRSFTTIAKAIHKARERKRDKEKRGAGERKTGKGAEVGTEKRREKFVLSIVPADNRCCVSLQNIGERA